MKSRSPRSGVKLRTLLARLAPTLEALKRSLGPRARALLDRVPRRAWVAGGVLLGALLLAALSFGPIVRARATAEAARRGLVLEVGHAHLGWFAVRLTDVRVTLEGVDGLAVLAPEARLELDALLHPTELRIDGSRIEAHGDLDALAEAISAWRARRPASPAASPPARHLAVRLEGGELAWHGAGDESLVATGLRLTRDEEGVRAGVASLHGSSRGVGVDVADGSIELASGGTLHELRAASLDLAYAEHADESAAATQATANEPAPPPLPVALPKRGARAAAPAAPPLFDATDPLLPLPHLRRARAKLALATKMLAERLGNDGAITVEHLTLHYDRGGTTPRLSLGPGILAVHRHDAAIEAEFKTEATAPETNDTKPAAPPADPSRAGKSALSLRASLPVERGDVRIALEGGPVALALLGVREGGGGLTDVERASLAGKGDVVLSADGDALTFDVDLGVRGLGLHLPRLSPDVVHGLDLGVRARGLLSEPSPPPAPASPNAPSGTELGELRLDDAELALGSLKVRGHGHLAQAADHAEGALGFEVPAAACQALFESIPGALLPDLVGAQMEGTFRGKGRLAFDSRKLDDLALEYDIDDLCKLVAVPEPLAKERFDKAFTHRVYHPDGSTFEIETGPGTESWSDLERISPYMQVAVLTTEDGAFFHHHGFNHAAIKSSLITNLKARKFVRGASTISMQTAKNLFLFRDKTLARKFEEVILTDYLEQNFTKEEIMQLYLNVIEFGPDLYGITAAAEHYFGRKPEELDLAECLFLSSLLPRPVGDHKLYEKGTLPESWVKNLQALMQIARKTEKISDAELKEGLGETIVFHKEGDPPPPPRAPISGVHFTGDDVGWQPVE